MTVAVGVVAHNDRFDMAWELANKVGAAYIGFDDGDLGAEGNHRRAWARTASKGAEWTVVLEDDAKPVDGFTHQLGMALDAIGHTGSPVVSLYIGRSRPHRSQAPMRELVHVHGLDPSWLSINDNLHAVGLAIRTRHVDAMLAHIGQAPAVFMPIDQAIGHWATVGMGARVAYTWPSLVDHADVPTVMDVHPDGRPRGTHTQHDGRVVLDRRRAWRTGTRDAWDGSTVRIDLPPRTPSDARS